MPNQSSFPQDYEHKSVWRGRPSWICLPIFPMSLEIFWGCCWSTYCSLLAVRRFRRSWIEDHLNKCDVEHVFFCERFGCIECDSNDWISVAICMQMTCSRTGCSCLVAWQSLYSVMVWKKKDAIKSDAFRGYRARLPCWDAIAVWPRSSLRAPQRSNILCDGVENKTIEIRARYKYFALRDGSTRSLSSR